MRTILSRTPHWDFHWFYSCEIIPSHIPVPAIGKIKKWRLARWSHAGQTSIRDVIVMLKWRHHVASQHIQDYQEVFFMFFQYDIRYLVVSEKNNSLFIWGKDRKNLSLVITVCHHWAILIMPIGDPQYGFFYSILTLMIDSYFIKRQYWRIQQDWCLKLDLPFPSSSILCLCDKQRLWLDCQVHRLV